MLERVKNLFLNANSKHKTSKKTTLNANYLNSVAGHIEYKDIKIALMAEDLGALISIFEHFKRFDTQISSEFNRRKMQVVRLPVVIESEDEAQQKFLEKLCKSSQLRLFLHELSAGIAYGFATFFMDFEAQNGVLVPKPRYINPRYFQSDNNLKPYISQGSERIYLDDDRVWSYLHPTDSGNFIEQSLIYKVVCIAALKHIAISRYMNYLDTLSVPPLIIKSDAASEKELSELLFKCALDLRSNGVGLFGRDDDVAVLNGNVDKETFLSFVRYCDECISKVITGQVLAGNSVQNGTQALGNVHQNIQKEAMEYDATLLSAGIQNVLERTLTLNFAVPKPFIFELDTNNEKDEKLQADTYAVLANMGVEIPIEHLEKTFKINGLKYRQNHGFSGGFGSSGLNFQGNVSKLATNSQILSENAQSDTAQKLLNKANTLYLSEFDRFFAKFKEQNAEFDFETFESLFENVSSFENAEKALIKHYKGEELQKAESLLAELVANGAILGEYLGGNDEFI